MTITLIIFGIYGIVCLTAGFYFGYLKREDKPPEFPTIPIKRYMLKKDKDIEQKGFYE